MLFFYNLYIMGKSVLGVIGVIVVVILIIMLANPFDGASLINFSGFDGGGSQRFRLQWYVLLSVAVSIGILLYVVYEKRYKKMEVTH